MPHDIACSGFCAGRIAMRLRRFDIAARSVPQRRSRSPRRSSCSSLRGCAPAAWELVCYHGGDVFTHIICLGRQRRPAGAVLDADLMRNEAGEAHMAKRLLMGNEAFAHAALEAGRARGGGLSGNARHPSSSRRWRSCTPMEPARGIQRGVVHEREERARVAGRRVVHRRALPVHLPSRWASTWRAMRS